MLAVAAVGVLEAPTSFFSLVSSMNFFLTCECRIFLRPQNSTVILSATLLWLTTVENFLCFILFDSKINLLLIEHYLQHIDQ